MKDENQSVQVQCSNYFKEYRKTEKFKTWHSNYMKNTVSGWKIRTWNTYKRKNSTHLLNKDEFYAFVEANQDALECLLSIQQERPEMTPVISKLEDRDSWLLDNIEISPKAISVKRKELWSKLRKKVSESRKKATLRSFLIQHQALDEKIDKLLNKVTEINEKP